MALWGCFHLMEFEFEFVVYFGRGGRVLKSGLIFANPLIIDKDKILKNKECRSILCDHNVKKTDKLEPILIILSIYNSICQGK